MTERTPRASASQTAPGAAAERAPFLALAVTLGVQTLAAVTLTLPSVLAPVMSADVGMPAQAVGWLVSVAYLSAMLSGLNGGGLAMRHGSVRLSQWALIGCCLGLVLLAVGHPIVLLCAAVVIGAGYGLPNPTAAEILSRHAPADRRGLFFSIKQTGVPLGVALTGLVAPLLLAAFGWRGATLVLAVPMLAAALWVGWSRRALEPAAGLQGAAAERVSSGSQGLVDALRARLLLPLRDVLAYAPTRRVALTSLVYAFTQVSFLTFLVSLLKIEHGHSLSLAAGLLSTSQEVSVVARIGWGHVSDRWIDPTRLLGLLGVTMGAGVALLGLLPATTPWPWTLAVTMLCAGTAVAWNGVFYADLVRHVPPARVAQATGATQFMTFMGGMSGSAAFAVMVSAMGGYSTAFAAVAVLPAATGVALLLTARGGAEQLRTPRGR
jgi:MFS family permease